MNQPEESPKSLQQDENCEKEKSVNPEIEGKISTTLDQILTRSTDDPERKGEIFQLIRKVVTAKYSGPLPPPEMLRLYNQYIPGSLLTGLLLWQKRSRNIGITAIIETLILQILRLNHLTIRFHAANGWIKIELLPQ